MSSSTTATAAAENGTTKKDDTTEEYVLPKVWSPPGNLGGTFGSVNLPTAGSRVEKELPGPGKHPLQLYSLGTPNGQKVTILLEELLELGIAGAEYDAYCIDIMKGDQFTSGFVDLNPNSKIPALLDTTTNTKMFESGSIMLQLSEKFDNAFCPPEIRPQVLNWLFWQMGSAPYVGGGFGHFYAYAPSKIQYAIDRFTMETKRQLDVLEKELCRRKYIASEEHYTIADIAVYSWYGQTVLGKAYKDSATFLNVEEDYPSVIRWAKEIEARPAVKRGCLVNSSKGITERHDASDFDKIETENKEEASGDSKKRTADEAVNSKDEESGAVEPDAKRAAVEQEK